MLRPPIACSLPVMQKSTDSKNHDPLIYQSYSASISVKLFSHSPMTCGQFGNTEKDISRDCVQKSHAIMSDDSRSGFCGNCGGSVLPSYKDATSSNPQDLHNAPALLSDKALLLRHFLRHVLCMDYNIDPEENTCQHQDKFKALANAITDLQR